MLLFSLDADDGQADVRPGGIQSHLKVQFLVSERREPHLQIDQPLSVQG